MSGSALTATAPATKASRCCHYCRRERSQRLHASTSRPFSDASPRKRAMSTRPRIADPATLEQPVSVEAEDSQRQEVDRAELNQLARMMPDPAEDELFDDGSTDSFSRDDERELFTRHGLASDLLFDSGSQQSYSGQYLDQYQDLEPAGGEYGYPDDLEEDIPDVDLRELELGLAQLQFDVSARRRWQAEQAEQRALELHHEQLGRGVNQYAQAISLAGYMEQIEAADHLAGSDNSTASWIRASFRLEDDWEVFAETVEDLEADQDMQNNKTIEETAMLMLDDENYVDDEYEAQATPARKAADAQRPSSQAYNDPDPSLDPLLACMPGMQLNEEDRDRFLQGDGDDNADEAADL